MPLRDGNGTKCTMPKSASLLFSNLASNGKHVGYAAYSSAVVVPDQLVARGGNGVSQAVNIEAEDGAMIQQMRWVQLQMHEFLVLATTKNLMIYSPDGGRLIHVVTAAAADGARSTRGRPRARARARRATWHGIVRHRPPPPC